MAYLGSCRGCNKATSLIIRGTDINHICRQVLAGLSIYLAINRVKAHISQNNKLRFLILLIVFDFLCRLTEDKGFQC